MGLFVALVCAAVLWLVLRAALRPKSDVPLVGSRLLFGYIAVIRGIKRSKDYLLEGYRKYPDRTFQFPGLIGPTYYVSHPDLITEIRKAPDNVLSFWAEWEQPIAMRYTFSPSMAEDAWHFALAHKVLLSSHVDQLLPVMHEELEYAFDKALSLPETGGKAVKCYDAFLDIIVRTNNRMLVGLPLCRNEEYTKFSVKFLDKLVIRGAFLGMFPKSWKTLTTIIARVIRAQSTVQEGELFLIPLIANRQKMAETDTIQDEDKPNDFLQWMMDAAKGAQKDPPELVRRLMSLNLATTHTATMAFTGVFHDLLSNPQYIEPLRDEAMLSIKDYGWTKDGIRAMVKMDSFFKESMRIKGIQMSSLTRRVLRPMTLSDGTTLPEGATVAANAWAIHHGPAIYLDPDTFDPWRFSRKVEEGESAAHNAFWTASSEYLVWGHGSHVCAGRYWATQVLKAMMAHILLSYDFKVPEGSQAPKNSTLSIAVVPDVKAKVEFCKRQA